MTNAQRGGGQAVLDMLRRELGDDVAGVIEDLVVGCECERAKPHPDPYLEGIRRLGAAPEHCIVFEVRVRDRVTTLESTGLRI